MSGSSHRDGAEHPVGLKGRGRLSAKIDISAASKVSSWPKRLKQYHRVVADNQGQRSGARISSHRVHQFSLSSSDQKVKSSPDIEVLPCTSITTQEKAASYSNHVTSLFLRHRSEV